ncbi:hypothetical protein CK203_099974 [Vitis vinifera]|uniref:Uncharacterized protein n=1 Tax=Vitis vinifera TaxID=29760 RepID=A0A438CIR1_VITVI|nr:hypothetical protein CK203_099974 [Vitis vinifera]
MLNKVLLGKWLWRYACDKDNLWKQVITVKYEQEGLGWRLKKANGAVGVGVWKEILKESDWCWDNMVFRAGKAPRSDFGQIFGVLIQHCPIVSLIYSSWLFIGVQRLRKCGTKILVKEAFFGGRLSYLEARKKWSVQGQGSL